LGRAVKLARDDGLRSTFIDVQPTKSHRVQKFFHAFSSSDVPDPLLAWHDLCRLQPLCGDISLRHTQR